MVRPRCHRDRLQRILGVVLLLNLQLAVVFRQGDLDPEGLIAVFDVCLRVDAVFVQRARHLLGQLVGEDRRSALILVAVVILVRVGQREAELAVRAVVFDPLRLAVHAGVGLSLGDFYCGLQDEGEDVVCRHLTALELLLACDPIE